MGYLNLPLIPGQRFRAPRQHPLLDRHRGLRRLESLSSFLRRHRDLEEG
ncbi:MAG: hypothetical protein MZU95_17490 [Desulfomicrobium escambiense]|nr:hypothetical protein [Desulfomicrobium escambiense]